MKCFFGLRGECIVIKNIAENMGRSVEEAKSEYLKDVETFIKIYCSYCIKAYAEKRKMRFSGRFGVGVTL